MEQPANSDMSVIPGRSKGAYKSVTFGNDMPSTEGCGYEMPRTLVRAVGRRGVLVEDGCYWKLPYKGAL